MLRRLQDPYQRARLTLLASHRLLTFKSRLSPPLFTLSPLVTIQVPLFAAPAIAPIPSFDRILLAQARL